MSDLVPLAHAHCLSLKGSQHKLTQARVAELMLQVSGWALVEDGHALSKTFGFDNYYQTMAFVNALAYMAHQQDHHPDLSVHYNRCVVSLNTHDVDGISATDIECARKMDALLV